MTRRPLLASLLLLLAAKLVPLPAWAQSEPVAVRIDAAERQAPVSPYLYGMFIEPIGNLVARSLWAEMLDDRKFYAPVRPADDDADPAPSQGGPPGRGYRKWRPLGGDDAVAMDRADPFVGAQSPSVAVGNAKHLDILPHFPASL